MSTIHIHNWASNPGPPPPSTETPTATSTSPTDAKTPPPPFYLIPHTLASTSTLLPAAALAKKAIAWSSRTNGPTPIVKLQGPDIVDIPPSSSSSSSSSNKKGKKHTKSKLKNGYVPKGYTLNADGVPVNTDEEATGTRFHVTETSMSETREELEGGGTREVWVRYAFLSSHVSCFLFPLWSCVSRRVSLTQKFALRTERLITVLIKGDKKGKADEE